MSEFEPQNRVNELKLADSLVQAKKLLDEGMYEPCLEALKQIWLEHNNSFQAMMLFARLLNEVNKEELARKVELLADGIQKQNSAIRQAVAGSAVDASGTSNASSASGASGADKSSPSWRGRHSAKSLEESLEDSLARSKDGAASANQSGAGAESSESSSKDLAYLFFEVGFGMIDIRQHELACMLLKRCLRLAPDEPTVCYELAFALMSCGKFQEAIPYFEESLSHANDFDTNLNLSVCLILSRRIDQARAVLDRMPSLAVTDEERKELTHRKVVLRRLQSLSQKPQLSARDWLYVLYGSVILRPSYKPEAAKEELRSVAAMLAVLKGAIENLQGEIEAIEYYSPKSKPLARILAELMEIPYDSFKGPDRPDRALLVMIWASDVIGPHESFVENLSNRSIFAYGLSPTDPLPVVPDLVGCLTSELIMPWEDSVRQDSIETVSAKIMDRARSLESEPDILGEIQDGLEFYEPRRELLVFNNSKAFPDRPEYTAEVQGLN